MMNGRSMLALALTAGLTAAVAQCQERHLRVRYEKDIDVTIVESDSLYVINMPSQFMSVRFEGAYAKQGKPTQLPSRIVVRFSSYAPKPLYQSDNSHGLRMKVDDEILDYGLLVYGKFDENNQSKESDKKTNFSVRAALPSIALVGAASKNAGLTLETMSLRNVTIADLTRLARARDVVMKIGDTVFPLTATHRSILNEFVEAITPVDVDSTVAAKPADPVIPADVPSDANQASLEQTLKWIKTKIEREGGQSNLRFSTVPSKLEPLDFKTCNIRYRVVPLRRETTVSKSIIYAIMEYRMDLGDLHPERVVTAGVDKEATVFVTVRDQPKIRVIKHGNEQGTMGRTLDEGNAASVSINLKSMDAAAQLKVALIHAINLCHAQH